MVMKRLEHMMMIRYHFEIINILNIIGRGGGG